MHSKQKIASLAVAGMFCVGMVVGCDDDTVDPGLDPLDMIDAQPGADPPKIKFPAEWQQADVSVNAFIARVLDICQRGDYDKFCNLFAISDVPPGLEDFKRIWGGVGELAVRSVRLGSEDPPQYFVHATVRLRQPDAQKRTQRELVIRVFKEMDEWRISAATSEIVRKVLMADSQPADSAPATEALPPSGRRPAAPTAGPGVYKEKSQGS